MILNSSPDLHPGQTAALVLINNIGDLLLLEPVLRYLNHFGITLDLYCTAETAMVWEKDTRLRQIIPIPSSNARYKTDATRPAPLPKERYDHLFDFRPTGRSVKLALRLRVRHRHTWGQDRLSRFFYPLIYGHRVETPRCIMRRDRYYLELLGVRGSEADRWLPARLTIPPDESAAFQKKYPQFLINPEKKRIILQPTARWDRKLWKVEGWREIIIYLKQRYEADCILISGPASQEQEMVKMIATDLIPQESVFAGSLSWRELSCAFALANGFIGLDSAPYHLAAMLGIPLLVLFGENNETEWGPVLPKQVVLKPLINESVCSLQNLPVSTVTAAVDSVLFN